MTVAKNFLRPGEVSRSMPAAACRLLLANFISNACFLNFQCFTVNCSRKNGLRQNFLFRISPMTSTHEVTTPIAFNAQLRECIHGVVAIVDDDPQISMALKSWVDLLGLQATVHLSGESLLKACRDEHPRLVGAVLDLDLPGVCGFELARLLRHAVPGLPIVIVTGMPEMERIHFGTPPSGITCLSKPFDLDAIEQALGLWTF